MPLVSIPIANWVCPCCKEEVPRLLPNGQRNQVDLTKEAMILPQATPLLENYPSWQDKQICLSCHEIINELLGSLVVPAGQMGDIFEGQGVANTTIIAGIQINDPCMIILAHPTIAIDVWKVSEEIAFHDFNIDRITYPTQQGQIDTLLWQIYQDWLKQLELRYRSQDQ